MAPNKVTFRNLTRTAITLRHDLKTANDVDRINIQPYKEYAIAHRVYQTGERYSLLDLAGETTGDTFGTDEVDDFERVDIRVDPEKNIIYFDKIRRPLSYKDRFIKFLLG